MTKDEKRAYLKSKGWRRQDRATGAGRSEEYWSHPAVTSVGGYERLISLDAAVKNQQRRDGVL